ncbi:hypothetical protein B0181_01635 [Moraxella caviae]|uniref:Uncharacterized protein n=1 Tax=Moraxella caviae TaxID=34060 RepID=A0A1T0A9S3_9GAMM|nr:hypothetical protein B0181_01635 [Moraxella caviae]
MSVNESRTPNLPAAMSAIITDFARIGENLNNYTTFLTVVKRLRHASKHGTLNFIYFYHF